MKFRFAWLLAAVCLVSSAVSAGPVFDSMLNYVKFDQRCPAGTDEDALPILVAGKSNTTTVILSKDKPLGQSFRVGSDAGMLWKVSIGVSWFDDSWQEDEKVTFSLYDSPKKEKKYYSRELDYVHKWFKWDLGFDVRVPCKPDQEFYWEITHNGAGDNAVTAIAVKDDNYPRGQAYLAGQPQPYDMYFETMVKPANPDKVANLKKFFGNFDLDYPPLAKVKAAYEKGDYETAGRELLEHFRTRTEPDSIYTPKKNPKYDRTGADMLVKHELKNMVDRKDVKNGKVGRQEIVYNFQDHMLTWRETWPGVPSIIIRPTDHISTLANAYYQTGDEAYVKEMMSVMRKFVEDYPSPTDGGRVHVMFWRPLNCGWRLNDAWDGWKTVLGDPKTDQDVMLGWLNFMIRMGDFVSVGKAGGNQESEAASGLFSFALRFPEFKQSAEWVNLGFERLSKNTLKTIRPDGVCREPAINYHGMMTMTLHLAVAKAKKAGHQVPAEVWNRLEGMWNYLAYLTQPSGDVPSYGDSDCAAFDSRDTWQGGRKDLKTAAELFNRPDWLYIATAGKEGIAPKNLSTAFPDSRYFIMRSDWNKADFNDARYAFFKAGVGGSHGHNDLGEIALYAYGMPLVIDPGRTNYGTTLMEQLARTESHSLCIVDGAEIKKTGAEPHGTVFNPAMDIVDNSYKDQYPGIENRRAILYVRSIVPGKDYWVLFDNLLGQPGEVRKFDQQFWLTPPAVKVDESTKTISTTHDWGGNLDLIAADKTGTTITQRNGQCDAGKVRDDIPVVAFHKEQQAPCSFTTVMFPYPVGKPKPRVTTNQLISGGTTRAISVSVDNAMDYIVYNLNSNSEQMTELPSGVKFRGDTMVLRLAANGKRVDSLGWSNGKGATMGKNAVAWSKNAIDSLSVRYIGDTVYIDASKPEPTLGVATQGTQKMVVNGSKPVEIAKGAKAVKPF